MNALGKFRTFWQPVIFSKSIPGGFDCRIMVYFSHSSGEKSMELAENEIPERTWNHCKIPESVLFRKIRG